MSVCTGEARHVVLCVQNLSVPEDRRVWREARTLAAAGFRVTAISPRGQGQAARQRLDCVDILRFRPGPAFAGAAGLLIETVFALVGTGCRLARLRARGRIDVLHVANPPDTFVLLAMALRLGGTRFVYDQHDLCPELLQTRAGSARRSLTTRLFLRVLLRLERLSYRRADLVVAPNGSYRRIAIERGGVPPAAVVVVRSGPDEVRQPAASDEAFGPPVIAFAGVMGHQDRVDLLLDAVALLSTRSTRSVVVDLIGRGDAVDELRSRAEHLSIAASVRWPGWLTGEELANRLARATIAVSLDDDSPFSRMSTMTKVPEYLALGLPSVIADLPENRVTAGDAARYFRPGDVEDLATRLDEVLGDADLLANMRDAALRRAPRLVWAHGAKRLLAAYAWLLDGGAPVPGEQVVDVPAVPASRRVSG